MKQLSSKNEIIDFLSNKKIARYLQKNKYGGVIVIQDENEKYNAHTVVLYPFNNEKKALVVELSEKRQDLDVMLEKEIIRCGHDYLVARSLNDVINYWNKMSNQADILHEKPLAATPFASYRIPGRFGWIMIAAMNAQDAMGEAERSNSTDYKLARETLEIWDGEKYINALYF